MQIANLKDTVEGMFKENSKLASLKEAFQNTQPILIAKIYRDGRGEYRWKVCSRNLHSLADSSQGYVNRRECENSLRLVTSSKMQITYQD